MQEVISNRLLKNYKHKSKWAKKNNIEAFRLYEMDIPDFPFIVDKYLDNFVIYFKGKDDIDESKNHLPLLIEAIKDLYPSEEKSRVEIFYKKRFIQTDEKKYFKEDVKPNFLTVKESGLEFEVCLNKYLDTGLFLDHRPLRQILKGINSSNVLNLFCYTGSLSIASYNESNKITSVDLSNTYLEWAKRNFLLNDINPDEHQFVKSDVFKFLENDKNEYDLIILDPPSFSQSKSMQTTLDIQRDQDSLVNGCMKKLTKGGRLYFSNNLRSFKLSPELMQKYKVKDLSFQSIPDDFRDKKIHQLYLITHQD